MLLPPSDPIFSANTNQPSWILMSVGGSTSMKMPFHCKLLYSSAIASTQPSASFQPMASQYVRGASAVRYKAPSSTLLLDGVPPLSVVSVLVLPEVIRPFWL